MHRDIKPENIMYDPISKAIKLVDFRSAIKFNSAEPEERKRVGTVIFC